MRGARRKTDEMRLELVEVPPDRAIAALAARQHGVISGRQLAALGLATAHGLPSRRRGPAASGAPRRLRRGAGAAERARALHGGGPGVWPRCGAEPRLGGGAVGVATERGHEDRHHRPDGRWARAARLADPSHANAQSQRDDDPRRHPGHDGGEDAPGPRRQPPATPTRASARPGGDPRAHRLPRPVCRGPSAPSPPRSHKAHRGARRPHRGHHAHP